MGGQEEEGGRAHQKSRGDARLDSLDGGRAPLVRSLGGRVYRSVGKRRHLWFSAHLARSLALLPAISRPLSPSFRQVHRGRHQVRSKMPRARMRRRTGRTDGRNKAYLPRVVLMLARLGH